MKPAKVAIVLGSESDRKIMEPCASYLSHFGVDYCVQLLSAHRNPEKTARFAKEAEAKGFKVIIAGAGMAAHLPGFIAAHTTLPVIGVPIPQSFLGGTDALLSMVQMPKGVPVATMALGEAGAANAAVFAVEILALDNEDLRNRLKNFKSKGCKI